MKQIMQAGHHLRCRSCAVRRLHQNATIGRIISQMISRKCAE